MKGKFKGTVNLGAGAIHGLGILIDDECFLWNPQTLISEVPVYWDRRLPNPMDVEYETEGKFITEIRRT